MFVTQYSKIIKFKVFVNYGLMKVSAVPDINYKIRNITLDPSIVLSHKLVRL